MYRLLLAMLAVGVLVGCSDESTSKDPDSQNSDAPLLMMNQSTQLTYGIGDAETTISLNVRLSDSMNRAGLSYREVETKKYELAMAELTVSKPYPEKLLVVVDVGNRNDFEGYAVQVKPRLFIDDREVATFGFVYGADAKRGQRNFEVDLMEYLDEVPATLLVHARARIHLFMSTDPAEVTIDTPLSAGSQSAEKLSNPLRVNFE